MIKSNDMKFEITNFNYFKSVVSNTIERQKIIIKLRTAKVRNNKIRLYYDFNKLILFEVTFIGHLTTKIKFIRIVE